MKSAALLILGVLFVFLKANANKSVIPDGTDIYYGGDTIITQFLDIQESLYNDLNRIPTELLELKNMVRDWSLIRKDFQVSVKDHLLKDNQEIAFLNYPYAVPKKIEISRAAWNCVKPQSQFCRHVVLHEMIHLMGYDDSGYTYSNRLIKVLDYWRNSKSVSDWMQPLFSEDNSNAFAYWVFININKSSEIPKHPFFWGLSVNGEMLNNLKKLTIYLKNKKNIESADQLLIQELEIFISDHEIKPIPEGLFMIGINIYYSNGREFCLFPNMEHFTKKTGRLDVIGLKHYNSIPANMQYNGYCD